MSTQVYLDPEKTAELEPSEWEIEGRVGSSISPFAVPQGAIVEGPTAGMCSRVWFIYSGGDASSVPERLDYEDHPTVHIWVAHVSGKITQMEFDQAVDATGLKRIGERLAAKAPQIARKAQRFSFVMISRVLSKLIAPLFEAPNR